MIPEHFLRKSRMLRLFLDNSSNEKLNFFYNTSIVNSFLSNVSSHALNIDIFGIYVNVHHLVLIILALFLVLIFILIAGAINARYLCCVCSHKLKKQSGRAIAQNQLRRGSHQSEILVNPAHQNSQRRSLLTRMIATIEEFDSLTPLIVTPCGSSSTNGPEDTALLFPCSYNRQRTSPKFRRPTTSRMTLAPMGSIWRRNDYTAYCNQQNVDETDFSLNSSNFHFNTGRKILKMAPIREVSIGGESTSAHNNSGSRTIFESDNGPNDKVVIKNPFQDLDLMSIDRTSFNSSLDQQQTGRGPPCTGNIGPLCADLQFFSTNLDAVPCTTRSTGSGLNYLEIIPPLLSALLPGDAILARKNSDSNNNDKNGNEIKQKNTSDEVPKYQPFIKTSHSLNSLSRTLLRLPDHMGSVLNGCSRKKHRGSWGDAQIGLMTNDLNSADSLYSMISNSPMDSSSMRDASSGGSPVDTTTGSAVELSDSIYMASESDVSENRLAGTSASGHAPYIKTTAMTVFNCKSNSSMNTDEFQDSGSSQILEMDQSPSSAGIPGDVPSEYYETPAGKRYLLHRIEEECEDIDRSRNETSSKATTNTVSTGRKPSKSHKLPR